MNNTENANEYSPTDFIEFLTGIRPMPTSGIVTGDVTLNDVDLDCKQIRGWRFEGKLDLSECRFKGGFRFENNSFGGKMGAGLALRRARINGQLVIKNCANSKFKIADLDTTTKDAMLTAKYDAFMFQCIDLREIVVAGGLDIAGSSLESKGKFLIALHSASLGGPSIVKFEDPYGRNCEQSYLFAFNISVRSEFRVEAQSSDHLLLHNGNFGKDVFIDVKQLESANGLIILSNSQIGGDLKIASTVSKAATAALESIVFRSARVSGDILINGHMPMSGVDGKPVFALRIESIDGTNSVAGGDIKLHGITVGSDSDTIKTLINLEGATSRKSISLNNITYGSPPSKCTHILSCKHCVVSDRLNVMQISPISTESNTAFKGYVIDFYGVQAKGIDVSNVISLSSTIDISSAKVSMYLRVIYTQVGRLDLRFASAMILIVEDSIFHELAENPEPMKESFYGISLELKGYVRLRRCGFGRVNLSQARIGTDLMLSEVTFTQFDLSRSIIGGLLDFDGDEAERENRFATKQQKILVNDKAFEWEEYNTEQRIACMKNFKAEGRITSGDRIVVDYLQAQEIDFRGCFFIPKEINDKLSADAGQANKTSTFISGIGMKINRIVKLRSSQFVGEDAIPGKDKNANDPELVDFSGANIGELDLAHPLPSPIRLIGAHVHEWGLSVENADNYVRVLKCTGDTKLDIPHYLRVEEMFENAGKRKEADEIHRKWRERECELFFKNRQKWRGLASWLHGKTLGYGTQRWKMVLIIFCLWAFSAVLFSWNHNHWLQPDTTIQSSLVQCGSSCGNRRISEPDTASVRQQTINGMLFALRQNVPLVDLVPVPPYEANPNTSAPYFVMLFRILGWLTWPVLLASVVSGLFPKRYQA